jgi:hypothetical protein
MLKISFLEEKKTDFSLLLFFPVVCFLFFPPVDILLPSRVLSPSGSRSLDPLRVDTILVEFIFSCSNNDSFGGQPPRYTTMINKILEISRRFLFFWPKLEILRFRVDISFHSKISTTNQVNPEFPEFHNIMTN